MINKKYRIFIALSIVWILIIVSASWEIIQSTELLTLGQERQAHRYFDLKYFLLIGVLPIVLFWSFVWIFKEKFFDKIKYSVVIVVCPNEECKQKLRFKTAKGADTKVTCPKCKTEFIDLSS